jgi:hypothetical protein
MGEHGPTLSLPSLEQFVEHRRGHGDHDRARDEVREEGVSTPEAVIGEVPSDRPDEDEQHEAGDDPRGAQVGPTRVGAAWTDTATSHRADYIAPPGGQAITRQAAARCKPEAIRP